MSGLHQSQLAPAANKFHIGNGSDGKHYWLTPPDVYAALDAEFSFDFDPCPYPLPHGFDGLTCEWGRSNYVNPPFGSIIHDGKKKGPTAWVRKAIAEQQKGKRVVLVYPVDKWVLMLMKAILGDHAQVRNLGDVKWLATEDGSAGKGTGRHIACFILEPDVAILRATRSEVTALADIATERQRQREVEGWTPAHDDTHDRGEMLTAAWCYMQRHADADMWGGNAADEINTLPPPARWPWSREWWKPTNRRRDLVKAGALIVAEIERLDRLEGPRP